MTQSAANYAKALFELNIPEKYVQDSMNIVTEIRELSEVLTNPAVKKNEKHAVIDAVFDTGIRSFLKVLCDNGAMGMFSEIFEAYTEIVLNSRNMMKAAVVFAAIPDKEQIEKLKNMICSKYNKAGVLLEVKEDPSLIGGFILSVGDREYDKSIKGALGNLNKTLARR